MPQRLTLGMWFYIVKDISARWIPNNGTAGSQWNLYVDLLAII